MESININIPKGYEIDIEKSNFVIGKIAFKKKELTYNNITKELFLNKDIYFINDNGIIQQYVSIYDETNNLLNNCTSREQAEKLLAINKLMNVAKYLNDGWKPDWNTNLESKYIIELSIDSIIIQDVETINHSVTYFKTKELAEQAIDILGKEIILKCFQNY